MNRKYLENFLMVFVLIFFVLLFFVVFSARTEVNACDNCTKWNYYCMNCGSGCGVAYNFWVQNYKEDASKCPDGGVCYNCSQKTVSYDCPVSGTDTCCLGSSGKLFSTQAKCVSNNDEEYRGCCDPDSKWKDDGGTGGTTQYTVTYNGNGGSCTPSSRTVDSGGTSNAPTCTRTGYTLNNFTKTVGTCGTLTASTGKVTNVTCNLTIRANWTANATTITCGDCSSSHRCQYYTFTYQSDKYANCADALVGLDYVVSYSCNTSCCLTCPAGSDHPNIGCVTSNPNQCCIYQPQPGGYYTYPCPTSNSMGCSVITDPGDPSACPDKTWYKESCHRCSSNFKYTFARWNRIDYATCTDAAGMPGTGTWYECDCGCTSGGYSTPTGWTAAEYQNCVDDCEGCVFTSCGTCTPSCSGTYPYASKAACESGLPSGQVCEAKSTQDCCDRKDNCGIKCGETCTTCWRRVTPGSECVPTICGTCTPSCGGDYPLASCPSGSSCSSQWFNCNKFDDCGEWCGESSKLCYRDDGSSCIGCDCDVWCGGDYPLSSCPWPNCQSTSTCCTLRDSCSAICSIGGSNQKCLNCFRCISESCAGCDEPGDFSCPWGQSTTPSGPLCARNLSSCTGDDGCGNICSVTGDRCYLPETNTAVNAPASVSMTIDGATYTLSTLSSSPTVVKYPTFVNTPTIAVPFRLAPWFTSRGIRYEFEANNEGNNREDWSAFGCARGEDFCINNLNTESTNFTPNTPGLDFLKLVLEGGAIGRVSGRYATINRCDDGLLRSSFLNTYYKVNNNPEFLCPAIVNSEDDQKTPRGCQTTTHTGIDANNPLKFRLGATDPDGNDQVEGAVLWLSKNGHIGEIPSEGTILPTIPGAYQGSRVEHIGVMLLKTGSSWDNPLVYVLDETLRWQQGNTITNTLGQQMVTTLVTATETPTEAIFDIELLLNEVDPSTWQGDSIKGNYQVSAIVFDTHMMLADNVVEHHYMLKDCRAGGWNIDLVQPNFTTQPSQEVLGVQEVNLSWEVDGTESNITDVVVNAYGSALEPISTADFANEISISPAPAEDDIGMLTDLNSWRITPINQPIYPRTIRINTGENESGSVVLHVTGFDQACNDALGASVTINLNPWMTAYGGIIYSQGSVGVNAKDVTSQEVLLSSLLTRIPNPVTSNLDIGTELISSRREVIHGLIHSGLGAVRAHSVFDTNSTRSDWFDNLTKKLEEQKTQLIEMPGVSLGCNSGENCYLYSENDITVPMNFVCDKNILFMSEGDILIEPNVTTPVGATSLQGCIFVAKDNIVIQGGEYQSSGSDISGLGYDQIDAFMIAENQIVIALADEALDVRDGLQVHGGMIAFGRDLVSGESAILINRSLRLFNNVVPTVVTSWDPSYAKISEIFFGKSTVLYKQEVGFKPY